MKQLNLILAFSLLCFATQNSRWVTSFTGFNNSTTLPVTLTGTWNAANASNSVTIYSVTMEVKKGNW